MYYEPKVVVFLFCDRDISRASSGIRAVMSVEHLLYAKHCAALQ